MDRNLGHTATQKAIYDLLSGNLSYSVYDYLPDNVAFPYITIGPVQSQVNDIEDKHAFARDVIVELNVWSREA
jgi:hypothetical protein